MFKTEHLQKRANGNTLNINKTPLSLGLPTEKATNMTSKPNPPKIQVTQNGPYLLSGTLPTQTVIIIVDENGIPIKWQHSTQFPLKKTCALCRCGNSKNKPYCDGTHAEIGFDGTETADNEPYLQKPEVIVGPQLTLIDFKELCASARFCHRDGGIWNLVTQPDSKARQTACEEAASCPSGRLIVKDNKTDAVIEPTFAPSICLIEDPAVGVSGPIWVRGGILVQSATGKTYQTRNRVTLCRCGKSQNKPFCDSSHYPEEDIGEKINEQQSQP
jgi:CDGSH-type Zn-finger protein